MSWLEIFAKIKVIESLAGWGFLAVILVLCLVALTVDFVSSVVRRTKRALDGWWAARKSRNSSTSTTARK